MEFDTKEFTRNLPSAEGVIRTLGLATRKRTDLVPSVALFGVGLLVGASLALLFAPTTGRALREGIGERAADLRERATAAAEAANASGDHRA